MAFSPAELVEEVRNEVLALKGGWAQVRMSHVLQVHDLVFLFLAIRATAFPAHPALCQPVCVLHALVALMFSLYIQA